MLIYFYELSLRLINVTGYNVFITENAWLSTDYGKAFQNFLQRKCIVHAIIDSDYKYFETADINTIITFFRNKGNETKTTNIRFFHCLGSIENNPCNTFSDNNDDNILIKSFTSDDLIITANKWSVVSSAEEPILAFLKTLYDKQDYQLAKRISVGQGLNITKNNIIRERGEQTVPYYISELGATYTWESSDAYVRSDIASENRQRPKLILPRGLGTHFCSINNCNGFSSSYVEIYGDITFEETLRVWLFCNSSLLWLLREVTGRTNLGGGMLKAEATDLRGIPLCFNFDLSKASKMYSTVRGKKLSTNLSETISDPQHRAIDNIVLTALGLESSTDFIVNSLISRVVGRMNKSRTK